MSARGKSATVDKPSSAREGAHVMEMQRRRLLLAMGELLAEGGIESATVGGIAGRAGVSRRTFYELFEDREDCFLATFDHAIESVRGAVLDAYERPGNWRERLRATLTVLLEGFDEDQSLARIFIVEALRAGPEVLERRAQLLATFATAIDAGRCESKRGAEPPPLTAQGIVGGAVAVIHARLLESAPPVFIEFLGPLMGMIVHPYLGAASAREELERPRPYRSRSTPRGSADPFKDLPIRFTYRTARVLATIASHPGASNRLVADSSGIADEGQMSRLLRRLRVCELIENRSEGQGKGEPNAWALTERGQAIHTAIGVQA